MKRQGSGIMTIALLWIVVGWWFSPPIPPEELRGQSLVASLLGKEEIDACLRGSADYLWSSSTDGYVLCPTFFSGLLSPTGRTVRIGQERFPAYRASGRLPVAYVDRGGDNLWFVRVLAAGIELESTCPDTFPVAEVDVEGIKWRGVYYYYPFSQSDCSPIARGTGTLMVFVQPERIEVEVVDWEQFAPHVYEQDVPSEVVGLEPVSFVPPPLLVGATNAHLLSLLIGSLLVCFVLAVANLLSA